jgi:hypothetical protein
MNTPSVLGEYLPPLYNLSLHRWLTYLYRDRRYWNSIPFKQYNDIPGAKGQFLAFLTVFVQVRLFFFRSIVRRTR